MKIQIAALCDGAADYGGKLNLLGVFDTIYAAQFPAVHPQCSIAVRANFVRIEEGHHKVKINFVDADGRFVMPGIEIPVHVAMPADSGLAVRNTIVNIQQLRFDRPGQYSIDIAFDGRLEASLPLHVKFPPNPTAAV